MYFQKLLFSSKHKSKKKSKSLSEVKSFSSFSFSDVALDYKGMCAINCLCHLIQIITILCQDYKLYKGDAGISGGLLSKSDPSQLDRAEISDQDQVGGNKTSSSQNRSNESNI